MALSEVVERILFPACEPYHSGLLAVGDGHEVYVEECGNPEGVPVLFVHGGPGAGCSEADRRFFDPARTRVVLVDQRGAGRSRPAGSLEANTVAHLVADFERMREELGIERWHLFGGSWGSTLSVCYAQEHPQRVLSLTLRGIWLMRRRDMDWWLYGLRRMRPEAWRTFAEHVPPERRDDLLEAYWELLNSPDHATAVAAAKSWSAYEGAACTLRPDPNFIAAFAEEHTAWNVARLEAHYVRNQAFEPDDLLLQRMDRIRHLPAFLVHGRYDLVCPVEGADLLHRAWPGSELVVVEDAGHASREPGTAAELVGACRRVVATGDP
ncbi:MAG TPA: prolyl aminopeptidase, partial [Planctomycetota bacterium]|nr:prolyl aminopeptidase [Planctomycetota bacterium]